MTMMSKSSAAMAVTLRVAAGRRRVRAVLCEAGLYEDRRRGRGAQIDPKRRAQILAAWRANIASGRRLSQEGLARELGMGVESMRKALIAEGEL